jgi:hypothetical protein
MNTINYPNYNINLTNTTNTNKVSINSSDITITNNNINSSGTANQVLGKTLDNSLNWVTPTLSTVLQGDNSAGNYSIDMNNQNITDVNSLSATSIITPHVQNGENTITIGTVGQNTNILGTFQNNGTTFIPYISSSGVASGNINMNTNRISGCPNIDCSSTTQLTIGGTQAGGVSIGRVNQPTNILGNIKINSSSGTTGQVLTSTGSNTTPSWQTPTIPYISSSGVASGNIDMNNQSITNCGGITSSSITNGASNILSIGTETGTNKSLATLDMSGNNIVNIGFLSGVGTNSFTITSPVNMNGNPLLNVGFLQAPTDSSIIINSPVNMNGYLLLNVGAIGNTGAGHIELFSPLRPNLFNYTTSTGTGVVNSFGYVYQTSFGVSGIITSATPTIIASIDSIPPGIYMVTLNFILAANSVTDVNITTQINRLFGTSIVNPVIAIMAYQNLVITVNGFQYNLSGVWVNTITQTLNATTRVTYTTGELVFVGNPATYKLTAVRIA